MLTACKLSDILHIMAALVTNDSNRYFFKEGSVSESGTHEELLALHGDYYKFVQLQALSKN